MSLIPLSDLIRFDQWAPDSQEPYNGLATQAKNVTTLGQNYKPFPSLSTNSNALPSRALGFFSFKDSAGTVQIFAGTQTDLYKLNGSTWTVVTRSSGTYNTAMDGVWHFTAYGDRVIATNFTDDMQSFVTTSSSVFSQLSTSAPKARAISVVNNFVMTGNTTDTAGAIPGRVRWCAIDDPTTWTASQQVQSGSQLLPTGGAVQAIAGTQNMAVILMEKAIWRAEYQGTPLIFSFTLAESNRGTRAPDSVVSDGQNVYYLGIDGFYRFDGSQSVPIGYQRIDKYFFGRLDMANISRVIGLVDPLNKIVAWAYPGPQAAGGNPTHILCYNWADDRWTEIEQACESIVPALSIGYTLEQVGAAYPVLENVPYSLDSAVWTGGAYLFGAFSGFALGSFSGANMTAVITSTEGQPNPAGRSRVTSVYPATDAVNVMMRLGHRNRQSDVVTYTSAVSPETRTGECSFNVDDRFFRSEVTLSGSWTLAQGVRYRAKATGV